MDQEVVGSSPTSRPIQTAPPTNEIIVRDRFITIVPVIETLDHNIQASCPAEVWLSHAKLKKLLPELYSLASKWIWRRRRSYWLTYFEGHLFYGDSRAAVVVSTSPLLVAAYTDEIDCIALLRFDDSLVSEYELRIGSRLITVNRYYDIEDSGYESDLVPGAATTGRYGNFMPLIADFLTHDVERLAERKAEINEGEWVRTETLGQSYLAENFAHPRDGRPCWSQQRAANSDAPEMLYYDRKVAQQEAIKRIFLMIFFAVIVLWALSGARRNELGAWPAVVVFGSFFVATVIGVLRLPHDVKRKTIRGKRLTIRSAYMGIGTFVISMLLAGFSEVLVYPRARTWQIAIWLATFFSTAAFYPFRDREAKQFAPNFGVWLIYSALAGFLILALMYIFTWVFALIYAK